MNTHLKSVLIACVAALLCCFSGLNASAQSNTASLTPDISSLETRFFDHTYPQDPMATRLDRLERMVFGEQKTGSDSDRLTALLLAVPAMPAAPTAPAGTQSNQPTASDLQPASTPDRQPLAAAGTQPTQPAPAEDTGEDITDSSDYPRVTQLEQEILGKTFVKEPIQNRLEQLELKAFGKASTSDLSDRTEALENYADKHFPHQQNNYAETADGGGSYPAPAPPYAQPSGYGSYPTGQTGYNMLPPGASLDQKVTWLEQQVFGASYPTQPLLDRVNKLAANIFPADSPQRTQSLADQVSSMIGAVELMPKQGSVAVAQAPQYNPQYTEAPSAYSQYQPPQYPQTTPFSQPQDNQYSYPTTQTTGADQNQATNQTAASQNPHHHTSTFMHGLAHVLGTVGSMAAGVGMMGGGMMGGGYGGFGL